MRLYPSFLLPALLSTACNTAPGPVTITLIPAEPTTSDDLEVQIVSEALDEDGDPVEYRYGWSQDGARRGDLASISVTADETAKGETWSVTVTAFDGELEGPPAEASVTILNTAPSVTVALEPTAPEATDALVAVVEGADPDGDTLAYSYSWTIDGEATAHNGDTVPAADTARGEIWEVTVLASDGEAQGEAASASIRVENALPVLDAVTITPTEAYEASTLEAEVEVHDPDGDPLVLSYRWAVEGILVQEGEVGTLTGELFDKGEEVSVEVTPDDGFGLGQAEISDPVTILNTPPAITGTSLDPADLYEASEVACAPSGWVDEDGDAEGYRYAWTVDGAAVEVTDATLDGAWFDRDAVLACTVTPDDGEDQGEPISSAAATVLNTPPVLDSVTLPSTSPVEGDTLTPILGTASDDDGDDIGFRYAWYVDGALAGTAASLGSAQFSKHQDLYVEVTPYDDREDGLTVTSAIATVLNAPPVLTSLTVSPDPAYTDDSLSALAFATDADGDSVTFDYSWTVDGAVVSSSGSRLSGSTSFDRGQRVQVTVTPTDGDDDGAAVSSTAIVISNSVPSISGVALSPSTIYEGSTVSCVPSGWADADGDAEGYQYVWTVNESAAGTSSTLSGASFDRGQRVACTATPDDGSDLGTAVTSASYVVANSPPVLFSASLSTTIPTEGDTLSVALSGAADDDGDPITYSYAWYVNGAAVATTSTLDGDHFDKGDTIWAVVTPSDGITPGDAVTSDTATAINSAPVLASAAISPTTLYTDSVATVDLLASDADGDSVSYRYAWTVDGAAAGSGGSLDGASAFQRGQAVQVSVTPTDGSDDGVAMASSALTVANSPPSAPVVAVSPEVPMETDALLCAVTSASSDADGDGVTYAITWAVDGASFTGATTTLRTGDTVPATATANGEIWACTVTPSDGYDSGDAASDEIMVGAQTFYTDADGDGYGDPASPVQAWPQPSGTSEDDSDCDDSDPDINPGAARRCGADHDCDGAVDGDWEVPGDSATIMGAVGAASDGDVICVGPGTYTEQVQFYAKDLVIQSTDGPAATIIDGGGTGPVIRATGGESSNATLSGFTVTGGTCDSSRRGAGIYIERSDVTLEDLVVTGNACTGLSSSVYGAGVYVTDWEGTMRGVRVTANSAEGYAAQGVGLHMAGTGTLIDVEIDDNESTSSCYWSTCSGSSFFGAGMWLSGSVEVDGLSIHDNVQHTGADFPDVYLTGAGLALYGSSAYTTAISGTEVEIYDNVQIAEGTSAYLRGAGLYSNYGTVDIDGLEVHGNSQDATTGTGNVAGGGICIEYSHGAISSVSVYENDAVCQSRSTTSGGSGALYMTGADVDWEDLEVRDNLLEVYGGWASAAAQLSSSHLARGLIADNIASGDDARGTLTLSGGGCELTNVQVSGNLVTASDEVWGGALYVTGSSSGTNTLTNVDIVANSASGVSVYGGAVYLQGTSPSVTLNNTIVADNAVIGASTYGGAVAASASSSGLYASYSDFWGNTTPEFYNVTDPVGVGGVISADPLYADDSAGSSGDWDLSLGAGSPCIDAGDPGVLDTDGSRSDMGSRGGEAGW